MPKRPSRYRPPEPFDIMNPFPPKNRTKSLIVQECPYPIKDVYICTHDAAKLIPNANPSGAQPSPAHAPHQKSLKY